MRIEFTVPGQPIAQPRARVFVDRNTRKIRACTAAGPIHAFKEACRVMFSSVHQGPPLEGPVYMEVRAVFARPKRLIWKKREMPNEWHTIKPDFDNVAKACADSLKGIAWRDDSQIAWAVVRKVYASGDEQPHTSITIATVDDLDAIEF